MPAGRSGDSGAVPCADCGRPLPTDSPAAQCPVCLARLAMQPENESTWTRTETAGTPPPAEQRRIDRYRLIEKIGEGGMGEVWLAEQDEPVKRRVALKVIKRGMNTERVVARFEAERQALALMDHPAVAKVFDAGSTPEGRPYFVMEYVKGVPITTHCDRYRLRNRERLALFTRVCEGVQHAHQKAIIHRDIKPSNVLVTEQGGKRQPKIIDFGVAKATAQKLTEKAMHTELGALIGTPEYMSPEQADLTAEDVDTRTDVYSLGVTLYELLVGALPFDSKELRRAGHDGIRKKILEEDPCKPSTRLGTLGDRSLESARLRRVDLTTLQRQLRGDLDWITMRALAKDRARRYASPMELAADLERHLRHEPVLASPPSTVYRMRKFVRRHTVGVVAVVSAIVVLAAFAVTMSVQRHRIATERDRANAEAERATREAARASQVSDFLVRLFEVSDPGEARGNTVTARELLDLAANRIGEELATQPEVQGRLMDTIGQVYRGLGLYHQAEAQLERALAVRREAFGPKHVEVAESLHHLGWLLIYEGKLERAEAALVEARGLREELLGPDHVDTAWVVYLLGVIRMLERNYDEAAPYYDHAQRVFEEQIGPRSMAVGWCLNDLAKMLTDTGRYAEAVPLNRQAYEIKREALGADHPDTASTLANLAFDLLKLGEVEQARVAFEEAIGHIESALGPEHPWMPVWLAMQAEIERRSGRLPAARATLQRAMSIREAHPDASAEYEQELLQELAFQELESGQLDSARRNFTLALEAYDRAGGSEHPEVLIILEPLAKLLRDAGRSGEAAAMEARAEALRRKLPPGKPMSDS